MSVRHVLDATIARPCDHYCDQDGVRQPRRGRTAPGLLLLVIRLWSQQQRREASCASDETYPYGSGAAWRQAQSPLSISGAPAWTRNRTDARRPVSAEALLKTARAASLNLLPEATPALGRGAQVGAILQMNETQDREFRCRRRAFIRACHPDRGGDTDLFTAGLRAFDTGREPEAGQLPKVVIVKRRPWLVRLVVVAGRRVRHGRKPSRVRWSAPAGPSAAVFG